MVGFGFAWTDSTIDVFNQLQPQLLDKLLEELFGQNGLNMGLMRHTIGSSDLSGVPYTYDDTPNNEPDPSLAHFDLGYYGTRMADMIAMVGKYKSDVTTFGSPWSYPAWMKKNGLIVAPNLNQKGESAYNVLNNTFDLNYFQEAAQYFVKYLDAFEARGAKINAITPLNEPLNNQGGYPCKWLDAADEVTLANILAPELKKRNVQFWGYDHNTDQPSYPQRVVDGGSDNVQAIAWHCYESPNANYTKLSDFYYANPGVTQYMSECTSYLPQIGDYSIWIAINFMLPIRNYANGGTFWVMATDPNYGPHSSTGGCGGCRGAVFVNSSTSYTLTHDYYMMGQFSRFIRRGLYNYQVLEGNRGTVQTWTEQFYVISIKNPDQSWAVVLMNNWKAQNVSLCFTGSDEVWTGTIEAQAVTTWLLPASHGAAEFLEFGPPA